MADIPVVVCTGGALRGARFEVPEDRGLKIGRAEDNDVVIQDDGVSRFHAELLYQNGSLWLQDAGSRNGVFVNGTRVTTHQQLKVGDEITVAEHTFSVRWGGEDVAAEKGKPEDETNKSRRRWFWPF